MILSMISQRCASSPPSSSPALGLVVASCGGADPGADGRLTVVATTTQAADLTRAVAGDRADVVQLLQPNSDPHDYEVRPQDVKALERADLVVRSGGELDHWLDGAIDSSGSDAPQLTLIDHVRTLPGDDGPDPHWWQDPRNAVRAVAAIEAALAQAEPGRRARVRPAARPPTRNGSRRSTAPSPAASTGCRRSSASSSPPTTRSATTRAATA